MLRTKFVLMLCASSLLTACSNPPAWWPGQRGSAPAPVATADIPVVSGPAGVPEQAGEAASEASVDALPRVFDEITTLVWRGDAAVVLETMAGRVGFRFERVGDPGQRGGNIDVKAVEKPMIDVLRMISERLSGRAKVVLDVGARTLELRYAS